MFFFGVIPRCLNFICLRFGTLCPIFIGRANKKNNWGEILLVHTTYEDGTDSVCAETSTYKIQTPGNYPKERIRHSEHGESLKLGFKFDVFHPEMFVEYKVQMSQSNTTKWTKHNVTAGLHVSTLQAFFVWICIMMAWRWLNESRNM